MLLPFVNRDGQRVIQWQHLVLVWLFIISATLFGSCGMGYLLVGDWRYGTFLGLALGVWFSLTVTSWGFRSPVDQLPRSR